VIVGNLEIWNPACIQHLAKWTKNRFLIELLTDVTAKGHTLTWADTRTVEELEKPVAGIYISHDNRQPKAKPHPRQEVDASTIDDRQPGDSRQEADDDFSIILDYIDLHSPTSPRSPQPPTPRDESRLQPTEPSESSRESGPSRVALTQPGEWHRNRTAVEDQEEDARRKLRLATLARARQELEVRKLEEEFAEDELSAILSKKRDQQIEESERASKRRRY